MLVKIKGKKDEEDLSAQLAMYFSFHTVELSKKITFKNLLMYAKKSFGGTVTE